jgi:hypothetical protein
MRTIAVTVVLTLAISVRAQPVPDGGAPPDGAPTVEQKEKKAGDEFSFELTPAPAKPNLLDEAKQRKLESRVKIRRAMLTTHQALGFITLGLLAVTNILGTFLYVDKYGGGTDTATLYPWHEGFAIATTLTFTGAALSALFAPNPYPKPIKLDAALLHKVSMGFAAACFIAQIVMGPVIAHYEGSLIQRDLALAHLVIGWASAGFMTVGTLAYVFK